ncbi:MAG TPA: methyltransferase [Trebonia sp.]|nr:methyltransferase [Trebonia sp.]
MTATSQPAGSEPPAAAAYRIVMAITSAWWQLGALRALVDIGGLDELSAGPLATEELARRCGASPELLAKVLRSVAALGLIRTASPGAYELTDVGRALAGSSALAGVRFHCDPEVWAAIGELPEALRAGTAPFVARHGNAYEYMASRPETAAAFYDLMGREFGPVAEALASAIDFGELGTVVDVGGGEGGFITAILRAHPDARGILADLPLALPEAREKLAASGLASRCEVVACDFFTDPLPAGAGVYLLAHIVHNFADEQATALLRAVRAAMPAGGKLVLVELVLPDDDAPHWAKDLDIRMMSFQPGGERTRPEYAALFTRAGFTLTSVTHLHQGQSAIVGVPAA